jgi:type I restriction enzyme R subunit
VSPSRASGPEQVAREEIDRLLARRPGGSFKAETDQPRRRAWRRHPGVVEPLFLAEPNILVDETITNDFKPFGSVMAKVQGSATFTTALPSS